MAIFGVLAGVAGVIGSALDSGNGACAAPTVDDVRRMLAVITPSDFQSWVALDTGSRQLSSAAAANDPARLVQLVSNSDCDPPHPFVARMYELLNKYRSLNFTPSTIVTTESGPSVIDSVIGYAGAIAQGAQSGAQAAAQAGTQAAQQPTAVRIDPLLIAAIAAVVIVVFVTR